MSMNDANIALLEVLGLGAIKDITSVDIALRPRELPRITMHQFCREIQPTATRFRLTAEPVQTEPILPPLNLDALQLEAQQRLHKHIERRALQALVQIDQQSVNYTKMRRFSC